MIYGPDRRKRRHATQATETARSVDTVATPMTTPELLPGGAVGCFDPGARAEQVSVERWARLANHLSAANKP